MNFLFEPCRRVLLEAAAKVGVDGAEEWLNNPNAGIEEVGILLDVFFFVLGASIL